MEPVSDPASADTTVDLSNIIPSEATFDGSHLAGNYRFDQPMPNVSDWVPDLASGLTDTFDASEALHVPIEFSTPEQIAVVSAEVVALAPEVLDQDLIVNRGVDITSDVKSYAPVDSEEPAEDESVSFLQSQDKFGFWHQTFVKVTLFFLGTLLLVGFAGQVIFHERDRIAAMAPVVTPWLETLCQALNCRLSPLRSIESIAIESSSFTKIRGDTYSLSFTLKNAAGTPLALPAIELTLTDSADQPVVRRVFQPSELKVDSGPLLSGAEWSAQLAMEIKVNAAANKVVGYRLLAFYP
jgi:hypothetical protein